MGFLLVTIVVTLNDLERHNGCYFALFYSFWYIWGPVTSNWLKMVPYCRKFDWCKRGCMLVSLLIGSGICSTVHCVQPSQQQLSFLYSSVIFVNKWSWLLAQHYNSIILVGWQHWPTNSVMCCDRLMSSCTVYCDGAFFVHIWMTSLVECICFFW